MSGRKCTPYHFTTEQLARVQFLEQARAWKREIQSLGFQIERLLQQLSLEGAPLSAERSLADAWMRAAQMDPSMQRNQAFMDPADWLANECGVLGSLERDGRQRAKDLMAALARHRVERRKAEAEAAARAQEKLSRDEAAAVSSVISRLVAEGNPGLAETFPEEIEQLRRAAGRLDSVHSAPASEIGGAIAEARLAQAAWNAALEKAQSMRVEAEAHLAAAEAIAVRNRELLKTWAGEDFLTGFAGELEKARAALASYRLTVADHAAEHLNAKGRAALNESEQLESLGLRRDFVAESLVKACTQLGFGIVAAPSLEEAGNPRSPMKVVADTYDEGIITFRITLDSIESDSCISKSYCFSDFDKLSEQLSSQFGVSTRFALADGSPRPKDREVGELDEPAGKEMKQGRV